MSLSSFRPMDEEYLKYIEQTRFVGWLLKLRTVRFG